MHTTSTRLVLAAYAALFIFTTGCSDEEVIVQRPLGEACDSNEYCLAGLVCAHDTCHQVCSSDTDCDELSQHCDVDDSICVAGTAISCGNGDVEPGEQCDDGAQSAGDGCSGECERESGWLCVSSPSNCAGDCGDNQVVDEEQCDDGNLDNGDGCSTSCATEEGWSCDSNGANCGTICGDDIQAGDEDCDDGNEISNDGCSATCGFESVSGSLADVVGSELSTEYFSDALTILDTGGDVIVTVTGGGDAAKLLKNSVDAGALSATYVAGDTLRIAMQSSDTFLTQQTMTLTIDGLEIIWSVTTKPDDIPDPFIFTTIADADLDTTYTSEEIQITGIDIPIPFSVSGPGSFYIILNGVSSGLETIEVKQGDKIKIQGTSVSQDGNSAIYDVQAGSYTTSWTLTSPSLVCDAGSVTFVATGAVQEFTLPAGCSGFKIQAWGAAGAGGYRSSLTGGAGGFARGVGTNSGAGVFKVIVGGGGQVRVDFNGGLGGYPNGGEGGTLEGNDDSTGGGGGGGRSEVRLDDLLLVVAGAGGGCDSNRGDGGAGGGTAGERGGEVEGGGGGTQIAGGQLADSNDGSDGGQFFGGDGNTTMHPSIRRGGGGGGDGYFGGASGPNIGDGGGGGGSGFVAESVDGFLEAGNRAIPGGLNEPGYVSPTGEGHGSLTAGSDGMVIITYY